MGRDQRYAGFIFRPRHSCCRFPPYFIYNSFLLQHSISIPAVEAKHICRTMKILLAPGNKDKKGVEGDVENLICCIFHLDVLRRIWKEASLNAFRRPLRGAKAASEERDPDCRFLHPWDQSRKSELTLVSGICNGPLQTDSGSLDSVCIQCQLAHSFNAGAHSSNAS